jgi:hypothetical protein
MSRGVRRCPVINYRFESPILLKRWLRARWQWLRSSLSSFYSCISGIGNRFRRKLAPMVAYRTIVESGMTGAIIESASAHIPGGLADDHGQFGLIVDQRWVSANCIVSFHHRSGGTVHPPTLNSGTSHFTGSSSMPLV